jgi:hypothetical protein
VMCWDSGAGSARQGLRIGSWLFGFPNPIIK